MNGIDLVILSPLLAPALAAVAILVALSIRRHHAATVGLAILGFALGLALIPVAATRAPAQAGRLLIIDSYALFYIGLTFAASLAVTLFSHSYLAMRVAQPPSAGTAPHKTAAVGNPASQIEEYYVLLLLAATGAATLAASNHFASFFLGLEMLSVSLYALIAYERGRSLNVEAGVKYLILAAVSTAFLLFGMALVYAELGTLEFARMTLAGTGGAWLPAGMALIVVGVGFKLALVPFHLWTPDVYQGAPAPVTAFIATVSKGAVFALLLRFFTLARLQASPTLVAALTVIAVASMLVGNLLALRQNNIKRLLAYSSIANLGYLLVASLAASSPAEASAKAGGPLAVVAATYYLVAYIVATLGLWGTLAALAVVAQPPPAGIGPAETIADFRGLAWRRPWLAALLAAMLFSLAGIPITAGFVGKFYVLAAGVASTLWLLVAVLIVSSAIGLFYYLRVIIALFQTRDAPAEEGIGNAEARRAIPLPAIACGVLAVLAVLLLALGLFPSPFVNLIQSMAGSLR